MPINEDTSFIEYNVDQPTQDFVTNFDTIGGTTDVILVTVDGVLTDIPESLYTVQQINHTTWRVTPEVQTGSVVRLYRVTNIDEMMHVFTAGAKFIARNMDNNFKQIRHSQQEVRDGFNKLSVDTNAIIDTLQVVGEAAQDAADAAEAAAQTANDAAAQVNDKVSYQDLETAVDTKVTGVIADGVDASFVVDASGKTQQEINDAHVVVVGSIADLQNTEPRYIGQLAYVLEYSAGTGYGGGLYSAVDNNYTGSDSEETLGGSRWRMVTEDHVFPIDRLGAIKDDPVTVKDAFIRAIECVREAGSGTVYVGAGEWTMAGVTYEVSTSNITFHFDLGCHFKMEYVLLGWYPTAIGKGYSNVSIVGRGTIEALPETMWHNDLVYVDGVELRDLTFIRPVLTGHFLDLVGSTNIIIDGITVQGSNVEQPGSPRLFSEFIQVGGDHVDGLGWSAKRPEYAPLMNQGIATTNTTLTNSVFIPYTDENNVTTYPPRPIGNHGAVLGVRDIRIVGNKFKDVIRQDTAARSYWLEMPTTVGVHISGNSFVCTNASATEGMGVNIIGLSGAASSRGAAILDNTFDITRPAEWYTTGVYNHVSGAVISVTGNVFKCAAEFSDIVALGKPCNIKVIGNSVVSTGRRFLFIDTGGVGSVCLVQGNDLVFNPPIEANYRPPVDAPDSHLTIVGNYIQHPRLAFRAAADGVCTAAGNTMVGGATSVTIANGVLTGNVFNTTTAPVVTIGGAAQTSQGWDFVHVPA